MTRVVVVDDDLPIRISLGGYLRDRDIDVLLTATAEETLELLQQETIDLLIVDIRLPGMDGNALILRAHKIQPSAKFLIHTGSTNYDVPEELAELGVKIEDVFQKPLADMSVIFNAIKRQFGKKESGEN